MMKRKEKTIKYRIRTGSQWLLISLLTTSTILPGITATVSASTKENTISQNSEMSQGEESEKISEDSQNIDTNQEKKSENIVEEDDNTVESLSAVQKSEKDIDKSEKASDDIETGIFGTSEWRLDSGGTLHIGAGTFAAGRFDGDGGGRLHGKTSPVKKIVIEGKVIANQSSDSLFANLSNVESIEGLSNLDTTNVTDMEFMFSDMFSLSSLDISTLNTSNVTNMGGMFYQGRSLSSLNVSGWNTTNVTNMSSMFYGVSSLSSLDVSGWNTTNVTEMGTMFEGMSSLSSLNVSGWNTTNVTNMSSMFYGVSSLSSLDVSGWNTSNVIYMSRMFEGASSLTEITGIGDFYTPKLLNMFGMFYGTKLRSLDLRNFDTTNLEDFGMADAFGMAPLTHLYLGEKFNFGANCGLEPLKETEEYTDKWINVGEGSSIIPTGDKVWSSAELINNYNGVTDYDEYVVLPKGIPGGDVTIKYVDENNIPISGVSNQILVGNIGEDYDASTTKHQISIPGYDIDTSKLPMNMKGTFTGQLQEVVYIYIKNQTAINVHDSNVYVGDEWKAEDNFDSALDKDGNKVEFKDLTVDDSKVDLKTPGTYEVTYSYDGLTSVAKVTVKEVEVEQDLAHIAVHDSELKVGDDWLPQDNFDKAISSDGKEVNFSDVAVSGAVDTKKPGTYEVTYSIPEDHWGRDIVEGHHTATAKIVVTEEKENDDRDSNSDKDNSSSTNNTSEENNFQNTKGLPKTGEHTSALIFMMGIALLVLGSIFSVLRVKKNKK